MQGLFDKVYRDDVLFEAWKRVKANKGSSGVDGLIVHSDQGWQYQYFRRKLKEHDVIQSMSRKGNCYDICIMETFLGRLKSEMYCGYEKCFDSFEMFQQQIYTVFM